MTDRDLSDTPRTDAMCKAGYAGYDGALADFARQLERELAEARRDAERYRWLRASKVFYAPLGYEADGERLDAAIDEAMKEK